MSNQNNNTSETEKIPSNFPKLYGGKLSEIFNYGDFIQSSATLGDLRNYANLYNANSFFNTNNFQAITVTTLNNIPSTIIDFLKNISSDVQTQLNTLLTVTTQNTYNLTNVSYDNVNNITNVDDSLFSSSFSVNNNVNINKNCAIGINLSVPYINNLTLTNQNINSHNINTSSLKVNNIPIGDVGVYLYCNVVIQSYGAYTSSILQIPIFNSCLASNLSISNNLSFSANIIIKPNYKIDFLDINGIVLYTYYNSTNSVVYFQPVNFNGTLYKINLFYNYIKL